MEYEFTVTLKPLLYKYTATEQFEKTSTILDTVLKGYKATIVAELTQLNNVHYHVLVTLTVDSKKILLDRYRTYNKYLGRASCDQVKDASRYRAYLTKSIPATGYILGRYPIIRDDWNLQAKAQKKS